MARMHEKLLVFSSIRFFFTLISRFAVFMYSRFYKDEFNKLISFNFINSVDF